MRSTLALTLGLALCVASATAVADEPIPQDFARMEELRRERLEWDRRTLQGAYDRVGKRDPKWDDLARNALDLLARNISDQYGAEVTDAEVSDAIKKAVDAGCVDPLVLFFYVAEHPDANADGQDPIAKIRAACDALREGRYPPIRRAIAALKLAGLESSKKDATAAEKQEAARVLDAVLDLIPESMADDPPGVPWDHRWHVVVNSAITLHRDLSGDHKAAYDRVDAKLARIDGVEALRLAVRGGFFRKWGWEARGTGVASTVTEENARLFDERLNEARRALERAWELHPVGTTVPNAMLAIEVGNGGGDREAMEKWFDRAMRADGNDQKACGAKLDWLDPKWYGDDGGEEMVAFGRACAATRNWQARLPLYVLEAHYRRFQRMDPDDWKGYVSTPEVWADFSTVYPEHLKTRPDDHIARSRYAMACYVTGHYREAQEQFQILGDNLSEWRTGPKWPLETMKQCREETDRFVADLEK